MCPNCGGRLCIDFDGYENISVCAVCGREFDSHLRPCRMTPQEFKNRLKMSPVPTPIHAGIIRE